MIGLKGFLNEIKPFTTTNKMKNKSKNQHLHLHQHQYQHQQILAAMNKIYLVRPTKFH